jgi:hypothetical protein
MLGKEWPSAVPADQDPLSDGTPKELETLLQHVVFWASHGYKIEFEERNGWLLARPRIESREPALWRAEYEYWFDGDGHIMQVL